MSPYFKRINHINHIKWKLSKEVNPNKIKSIITASIVVSISSCIFFLLLLHLLFTEYINVDSVMIGVPIIGLGPSITGWATIYRFKIRNIKAISVFFFVAVFAGCLLALFIMSRITISLLSVEPMQYSWFERILYFNFCCLGNTPDQILDIFYLYLISIVIIIFEVIFLSAAQVHNPYSSISNNWLRVFRSQEKFYCIKEKCNICEITTNDIIQSQQIGFGGKEYNMRYYIDHVKNGEHFVELSCRCQKNSMPFINNIEKKIMKITWEELEKITEKYGLRGVDYKI